MNEKLLSIKERAIKLFELLRNKCPSSYVTDGVSCELMAQTGAAVAHLTRAIEASDKDIVLAELQYVVSSLIRSEEIYKYCVYEMKFTPEKIIESFYDMLKYETKLLQD